MGKGLGISMLIGVGSLGDPIFQTLSWGEANMPKAAPGAGVLFSKLKFA